MLLFMLLAAISIKMEARFYQPISDAQFYKYIEDRHDLDIVLFVPYAFEEKDAQKVELMQEAFRRVSRRDRYRDAEVAFIGVHLDELPDLVRDFTLSVDQPTLMLFKKGQVVRVDDKIFKHVGYANKLEIEDLIEEYFGTIINERLARKAKIERIRQEERAKQEQHQAVSAAAQQQVVTQPQTVRQVEYVTYPTSRYVSYPSYYRGGYWPGFGIGFGWGRRGWGGGWHRGWRGGRRR
jgi:hypothetical protein